MLNLMESIAALRSSKGRILLVFLLLPFILKAQIIRQDSVLTTTNITSFSTDRNGNILVGLEGGTIVKYSAQLDSILSFSPQKIGDFSLLEAWHGFKIFGFRQNYQEFYLFDQFLTRATHYNLSETGTAFTNLATISSDQNLWVIEENDFGLYKIDLNRREVILSVSLEPVIGPGDHNFTFIREYQNLLFLADATSGIFIFDNMGNYLKQITVDGVSQFCFRNKDLLFITEDKLHVKPLYNTGATEYDLGLSSRYSGVLVSGNRIVLVSRQKITLCTLN